MADQSVKVRSPRYPVIGLREAIERVREVYKSDYRNKIPKDIIATHMGYSGLNGKSLGVISAVSKYGLLEGGRDSMWVAARAVDIIERELGDTERVEAIRQAASAPEPFREIAQQFPGKASDAAIRSFLITKRQYLPDSAERLVRSYRETEEVVETECAGHEPAPEADDASTTRLRADVTNTVMPPLAATATGGSLNRPIVAVGEEREWIRGPLSRDASYRLIVSGNLGARELGKLITLLKAQQAVLSDDDAGGKNDDA